MSYLDERSLFDLSWYGEEQTEPLHRQIPWNVNVKELIEKCIDTELNFGRPTPTFQTWWFEPIVIIYMGGHGDTFKYAYPSARDKVLIADSSWGALRRLGAVLNKPRILHFLGARRYEGRTPAKDIKPLVLISVHHFSGDEKAIYTNLRRLADTKQSGHQPFMYIEECGRLNTNFLESLEDL